MRRSLLLTVACICMLAATKTAFSQNVKQTPVPVKLISSGVINFKTLAENELKHPPKIQKQRNNEEKEENLKGIPTNLPVSKDAKVFKFDDNIVTPLVIDQVQSSSPPPVKSFPGLQDNNAVIPPDDNGAAGPNHLFETLNSQYEIFNKTGGVISTLSLAGFWSGLSTVGSPYSDPHIVYDAQAGRWISCIIAQLKNGHYGMYVAGSQTNDPTGSWFEYSFDVGPSSLLPDYPLLGYNKNWVVIATNDFQNLIYNHVGIMVFNITSLFAGTLTTANTFTDNQLFTVSPAETMDATQETEYMLNDYNGNSGNMGYVKLCTITGTADAPVYTSGALLGVNKPWSDAEVDAPQKGNTNRIQTNGTRMRTVVVRNGYVWATHSISLPANAPTRSSAAWWQINPVTATVVQYGRLDDPSGKYFLGFPSLAVTATNDVLLGSSIFASTLYAGGVYAYRHSTDASNTLRLPKLFAPGLAPYYKTFGSGRNRWGDYTATCIDPTNGSFWTLQQYASATNKWGTYWANVNAVASPESEAPVADNIKKDETSGVNITPNPGKGNFVLSYSASHAGNTVITVYDVKGLAVYTQEINVQSGVNRINLNLEKLISGNYSVHLQNGVESKKIQLVITVD
jgi:hypothetical protein